MTSAPASSSPFSRGAWGFPVVYVDPYWGTTVSQDALRGIVAVAIRYR
jgi:hypothetical protein